MNVRTGLRAAEKFFNKFALWELYFLCQLCRLTFWRARAMKDFSVADRRAIEFFKGAMKVDDVISVALFYLRESKEINLIKKLDT